MSINELKNYYALRQTKFADIAKDFKQKVFINSLIRVLVFGSTILAIYYFSYSTPIILVSLIVGITVFLFFVKRQLILKSNLEHNQF
jgi:hypothetical protein